MLGSQWRFLYALGLRLRQPGMAAQRAVMVAMAVVLLGYLVWAFTFLARQENEDAMVRAAGIVFAGIGVIFAVFITLAVIVRRKTKPTPWGVEDVDRLIAERHADKEAR